MLIEKLNQIVDLRRQINTSLQQRGLTGKLPDQLLIEARAIMRRKIEDRDPNIDNRTFNWASGILGLIGRCETQITILQESLARSLKESNPSIPEDTTTTETIAAGILSYLDLCPQNPDQSLAISCLIRSLRFQRQIELLAFTCPEVDFNYLKGPFSSYYIKTSAGKNSFDLQWQRNRQMFRLLSASGFPIKVNIIVGELDEESYIFPVLGDFDVKPSILNQLRTEYRQNLAQALTKRYPEVTFSIMGWSELIPPEKSISQALPSLQYLDQEKSRMRTLMAPGKYYDGVLDPNENQLTEICRLKMLTYATQGIALKQLFLNAIGLQNEVPARLRTLMLNAGLISQGQETIPFIYPYKLEL